MSSTLITGTLGGVRISDLISASDSANRSRTVTLQAKVDKDNDEVNALSDLQNDLQDLGGLLTKLADPQFFRSKTASVSDSTIGTGTVDTSLAALGTYDIAISQVASDSTYRSAKATPVVADGTRTVESVFGSAALGTLRVGTPAGTAQIAIDSTTTLAGLAAQMQAALGTGASVAYQTDPASADYGKFTIAANDSIILSSGTSTFLQDAHLYNGYSVRSSATTAVLTPGGAATMADLYGPSFVPGTFTLNGVSVQVNAADTADSLIGRINAQVPGVAASVVNGRLTINSTSSVTVANGTGSFFNQAGLGTASATGTRSDSTVGHRSTSDVIGTAGSVTVNGVSVSYAATDSLQEILYSITNSDAGVAATYDSYNDQLVLTAKTTGPTSIAVSGVGSGLAAYGLGNGTFTAGNSTVFSVDGGPARVSASNVLDSTALGLTGVTFTASRAGNTALTIGADVAGIKLGIDSFVTEYNKVQSHIASDIVINSTDNSLSGTLSTDTTVVRMPQQLRILLDTLLNSNPKVRGLQDLGVSGNADDYGITASDATKLTDALNNHLQETIDLFTDGHNGVVAQLQEYVNAMSLSSSSILGSAVTNQNDDIQRLKDQIKQVNSQADLQKVQLQNQYAAYENAYSNAQASLSYLKTGSSSSSGTSAGGIL